MLVEQKVPIKLGVCKLCMRTTCPQDHDNKAYSASCSLTSLPSHVSNDPIEAKKLVQQCTHLTKIKRL